MTIQVTTPDGQTLEVTRDALALPEGAQILGPGDKPKGFVPEDYFKAELKRRTKDTGAVRRDLEADPEFIRGIFEANGLAVGDDGKPKVPDVSAAVQTARQKWEAEQLRPVQESLTGLQRSLASQALLAAAKGKVRDEFASPLPGGPSYVETALGARVRYDAELGYVVALDAEGNPLPSGSPQAGRPYADAAEYVDAFLASEAGAFLRREERQQQGAGYRGGNGSGAGPKTISRADFDAMPQHERGRFFADGGKVTD